MDLKNSFDLLKEMVRFVAVDTLNFTFDALLARGKKEYNDFMPTKGKGSRLAEMKNFTIAINLD